MTGLTSFSGDLHALEESYGDSHFHATYLQLEPPLVWSSRQFLDADIELRRFRSRSKLYQDVRVTDGWTTIAIVSASGSGVVWNGEQCPATAIGVITDDRDHTIITPKSHYAIELDIPTYLLDEEGVAFPRDFSSKSIIGQPSSRSLWVMRKLEGICNKLDVRALTGSDLRRSIFDTVIDAIEASVPAGLEPKRRRKHELARRAAERIRDSVQESPRVEDLAQHLSVTPRTLQRAFTEVFEVTPKAFMIRSKLHEARRRLRLRNDHGAITELSEKLGFSSPSRFAAYYVAHFGETPRETLRQAF